MDILIEVILKAGRSAVELSLFILLPVMVVMLTFMRLLEAKGALDWLVPRLAPVVRPVGLTGLGVFAALQILPGVAVLLSAGKRVAAVWKPAALGACVGILVRTVGHGWLM